MKVNRLIYKTLIFVLIIISISTACFANEISQKNETVYVNLDAYGTVKTINVHNEYYFENKSEIIDNCKYINYKNLSNSLTPVKYNEGLKWNVLGLNRLSYTGQIENEKAKNIPWNIKMSYKLNGIDVNVEDLIGKSGVVKVTIEIEPNKNANEYYQNNYMLEVTNSFDMKKYISINSEKATVLKTGNTETLMFVVLPGMKDTYEIDLGTDNFEMDGFTFAMIPLQGEIYEKIVDIAKNKDDIERALDSLNYSTDVMLNGMNNMTGGFNQIIDGTNSLKNGGTNLNNGANERIQNLDNMKKQMDKMNVLISNSINDIEKAKNKVNKFNKLVEDSNKQMKSIENRLTNLQSSLDDLEKIAENLPNDLYDIKSLINNSEDLLTETDKVLRIQIAASNYDTTRLSASLNNIVLNTRSIGTSAGAAARVAASSGDTANAAKYAEIATKAGNIGTELSTVNSELTQIQSMMSDGTKASLNMVDDMNNINCDLRSLENNLDVLIGYSKNAEGTVSNINNMTSDLKKLLKTLNDYTDDYLKNAQDMNNGLDNVCNILTNLQEMEITLNKMLTNVQKTINIIDTDIYSGTLMLSDGLIETLNQTMNIFSEADNIMSSKNIVRNILKNRADELTNKTTVFNIDPNAKVISFTQEENDSPNTVQILLKTDSIKEKVNSDISDMEKEKEKTTLWEKIVYIFKKIFDWIIGIFK